MFPPSRIPCLTAETVETLYLLGAQDRIVGLSGPAALTDGLDAILHALGNADIITSSHDRSATQS